MGNSSLTSARFCEIILFNIIMKARLSSHHHHEREEAEGKKSIAFFTEKQQASELGSYLCFALMQKSKKLM